MAAGLLIVVLHIECLCVADAPIPCLAAEIVPKHWHDGTPGFVLNVGAYLI